MQRVPDLHPGHTLEDFQEHQYGEKDGVEPDENLEEVPATIPFGNDEDLYELQKDGGFCEEYGRHVNNLLSVRHLTTGLIARDFALQKTNVTLTLR